MDIRQLPLHRSWGLVPLLLVAAALFWMRASIVGLPWTDEQYTLLAVHRPPARIVELCTFDAHPPGYYFLLKLWMKPFRLAGIEPGSFIGRCHGLAWRLLALTVIWCAGRRAFGPGAGTLAAWMICLSPRLLEVSAEMRQYSVIAPTLPALFLLMMAAWRIDRESGAERHGAKIAAVWALYGMLAAICLWCQLVTGFVLFSFGVAWIAMCLSLGKLLFRSPFFIGGAVAQFCVVASFLPWLARTHGNYRYLMGTVHVWMTPATPMNLFLTAAGWMPYGQEFHMLAEGARHLILAVATAGIVLPFLAWAVARIVVRDGSPLGLSQARAGLLALACGGIVVLAFWLLARFKLAQVFHGPRYPVAGLGTFIVGLSLLACAASSRLRRPWIAPVLLLPWAAVSVTGIRWDLTHGYFSHMVDPLINHRDAMPPRGEPVYAMPPELLPYAKPAYADWDLRRIEELRDHPPEKDAVVVHFSMWSYVGDPCAMDYLDGMRHARLSRQVELFSDQETNLVRLRGLRPEALALIGKYPSAEFRRDSIGRAVSEAGPEWQNPIDGWYELETEGFGRPIRRATSSPVVARFNRPVDPGKYILRVSANQLPYPTPKSTWRFRFPGEQEAAIMETSGWEVELEVPIELKLRHEKPLVAIERPTWIPADWIKGSEDLRPFSFTLRSMWLEKREP